MGDGLHQPTRLAESVPVSGIFDTPLATLILGFCRTGDVKDFVKKIKLEDGKIALKKQKLEKISALAKARASEAAKATIAPPTLTAPDNAPSKLEAATPRIESAPGSLAAPRPVTGVGNSPIHPSLPPKPGSPSKFTSSSQESLKNATASPRVADVVAPTPAIQPVTQPIALLAPATVDPEIAKYEEVRYMSAQLLFDADYPPRINSDGPGLRFVQLVISTCNISER